MLVSTDSAHFGGAVWKEPRARARGADSETLLAMADGD